MAFGKNRLYEMNRRLSRVDDLKAWKQSFDNNTKEMLINWITQNQLKEKGEDGLGNILGYYSLATEKITKGRKKAGDRYTLEDTGDFFRSIEVEITSELIIIFGDGQKGKDNLYTTLGNYITTLNDENIEKLKKVVEEKYIQYIKRILQVN